MKTYIIPQKEIKKKWYLVNASGKVLGRLASQVAFLLRGKHKPYWSPHQDVGDYVVVINASQIRVTGKKLKDKKYYRHSGYPGGLKTETLEEKMGKNPCQVIRSAVWGMLPHNRLGRRMITKLKVYPQDKHSHKSQKLEIYEVNQK
jgi:large subunit ribosomal protein L13